MGRFSQAISEGDGISVVPVLEGDVEELARQAEAAGAEALAVWSEADAERARAATTLPILVRESGARYDADVGLVGVPDSDACVLRYERHVDDPLLPDLHFALVESGVDCVVDVRDEEELQDALERLDPEILMISERDRERDEDHLERALDLLPDVPAGKLVVAESGMIMREQALALERAGIDAVLVGAGLVRGSDFAARVAELTGR